MADIRPLPPQKTLATPSRYEKLTLFGRRAKLAWYKSAYFVASRKDFRMTVLQIAGAAAVLVGIALLSSIAVALIVGGVGAILVAERQ